VKCHKWVRRCGSHSVEEERRILLFLRMREGPFLLQFFDQVGIRVWEGLSAARRRGGARGVIRLLLVGLAARAAGGPFHRLRDGPCKPSPWRVIGLVLAQDVQGRFQGIKRRQLSPGRRADSKSALRGKKSNRDNNNKKRKRPCQSVGQNGVHVGGLVYPVIDNEVRLQGASFLGRQTFSLVNDE